MLNQEDTITIDSIGWKDGIAYMDVTLNAEDGLCSEEQDDSPSDGLEYVWRLLKHGFSFIQSGENYFPYSEIPNAYWNCFCIMRLSYDNFDDKGHKLAWAKLKEKVRHDYSQRGESIFRNTFSGTDLDGLIEDCIDDFPYEDRSRIEFQKLRNLILFVYDYCIFSLRESVLHPLAASYIPEAVKICGKYYTTTRTVTKAISRYLEDPYQVVKLELQDGSLIEQKVELDRLDVGVVADDITPNSKGTDSNVSAMFIDLMHSFFNDFGLKKRAEWAPAEKRLLFEMLRFFNLCGSAKKAKDSNYITTLAHDHKNYFSECKLHYWIRDEYQPYSYLMRCGRHPLFERADDSEQEFIEINRPGVTPISPLESLEDIAGEKCVCTNTEHPFITYLSAFPKKFDDKDHKIPDPRLSYVVELIKKNFVFITFVANDPKYMIIRKDLLFPGNWNRVIDELEQRILHEELVLRGQVDSVAVRNAIHAFWNNLSKWDRGRFSEPQFYCLYLFIFDYVMFTYKEAALREEIKRYLDSKVEVGGQELQSTALIDDMLIEYITNPYEIREIDERVCRTLRSGNLLCPKLTPIGEHPKACVTNMTAMFYDLFARFFSILRLQKRKGAQVSEQEKDLIAQLLRISGICRSEKATTVSSIYMKNKHYFERSLLSISVRENEYWHLMLNNKEEEMFGSPYR